MLRLPNKTRSGYDDISNTLLKKIIVPILKLLVFCFNDCLSNGYFPEAMKHAEIIPLFKSKEKFLLTNYRPISLLFTLSKYLEHVIHLRISDFFEDNNLFFDGKYGFRKMHNTVYAAGDLLGKILKAKENNKIVRALFIDLSKNFDTIDQTLFLNKCEKYGIRGTAKSLLRSYLSDRDLIVKVNSHEGEIKSQKYNINIGILADPGGRPRRAPPHKGPNYFVLTYKFYET